MDEKGDVIRELRAVLHLPGGGSVSDEDIQKATEGSFLLARIKLRLALRDLRDEVWRAIRDSFARRKR